MASLPIGFGSFFYQERNFAGSHLILRKLYRIMGFRDNPSLYHDKWLHASMLASGNSDESMPQTDDLFINDTLSDCGVGAGLSRNILGE